MEEDFKVQAEVVKVRRHCPLSHKVSDPQSQLHFVNGSVC